MRDRVGNEYSYLGEWNRETWLPNGRGVYIYNNGEIWIGYFNNRWAAPGNYVEIKGKGEFVVGEYYKLEDESLQSRYTEYKSDGTTEKHGY